jgi:hypothetical protein
LAKTLFEIFAEIIMIRTVREQELEYTFHHPIKTKKEEPDREFHVGDAVKVKLRDGRIVALPSAHSLRKARKCNLRWITDTKKPL